MCKDTILKINYEKNINNIFVNYASTASVFSRENK
jgi:hypothetical protein